MRAVVIRVARTRALVRARPARRPRVGGARVRAARIDWDGEHTPASFTVPGPQLSVDASTGSETHTLPSSTVPAPQGMLAASTGRGTQRPPSATVPSPHMSGAVASAMGTHLPEENVVPAPHAALASTSATTHTDPSSVVPEPQVRPATSALELAPPHAAASTATNTATLRGRENL